MRWVFRGGVNKQDIFAADMVNDMVVEDGVSFRDAYVMVRKALDEVKDIDLEKNIISKKSLGSPGNLDLGYYKKNIKKVIVKALQVVLLCTALL